MRYIEDKSPQGSDEWKLARCGIATASRFSAVMATIKSGEAAERRNYRADLVVERLTGKPTEYFTTSAMKAGTENEPFARMAYESKTGLIVNEVGFFRLIDVDAGASPDGIIDGQAIGIEIKCPQRATHLEYLRSTGAPPAYYWQIMGQMWVCDLDAVDFVSFNADFPEHLQLLVRRIKRDEEAITRLESEVIAFMDQVKNETELLRNMKEAA